MTDYTWRMIKTFADKETLELYETGKSKRVPPDIRRRAMRRLEYLDMATRLEDLKVPPGNRLHELQRERKGQYSISVNDQWWICFRFEDGDACDVKLTDYLGLSPAETQSIEKKLTRRSQVQILAPLPIQTRGYGEIRAPFFT